MTDAETLELLVRGGAVGVFASVAIAVGRGGLSPARFYGVLFCMAAAAHTLTQFPTVQPALGAAWPLIWALSAMGAGLFWAFAMELFEDRGGFDFRLLIPSATLLLIGIGGALALDEVARSLWLAHNAIGAALILHVLLVVAAGWRNDLVESRRRLRGPILAVGGAYALAVTIVQITELFWGSADALSPLAAFSLLLLAIASAAAFLRADSMLFGPVRPQRNPQPPDLPPALTGDDARLAAALDHAMRDDRLYREPGLTVSMLAQKLRVPEHRLRRLINQRLGHRNFPAFLNQWRLGDAKQALADPGQSSVPISTIGLDAGFQSLGPFNRAFKAETGLTPSAYRTRALGGLNDKP